MVRIKTYKVVIHTQVIGGPAHRPHKEVVVPDDLGQPKVGDLDDELLLPGRCALDLLQEDVFRLCN
jgi:hypothetical protein